MPQHSLRIPYRLHAETALSLTAPILWTPVTNEVTVNGGFFNVSVNTTETAQFFRLRKP